MRRFGSNVPLDWLHVLNWGGLRGAIALALALSLPEALGPGRDLLKLMAFGVVLFTLLAQSTTIRPLLKRLGLITHSTEQIEYTRRHARLVAARAALAHLETRHAEGLISSQAWEQLRPRMTAQIETLAAAVRELLNSAPDIEAEELDTARREALSAQRSALLGLRHDGIISEEVFTDLAAEVDAALVEEGRE